MRVFGGTRLEFSRVILGRRCERSTTKDLRLLFCALSLLLAFGFSSVMNAKPAKATATASTLSMTVSSGNLSVSLNPSLDGTFGASTDASISVSTNNFSGYTLSVASQSSSSMFFGENEIESISSITSYSDFSTLAAYKNKWGYKPSKYQQTVQGETSIVNNTSNYLPAPSTEGDVLDITAAANSTANTYTLSFGAKVDMGLPNGTYTYTYILQAVANPTVYNITYNPNASDGVSSMPSPNPQIVELSGGTDVTHSIATLSNATPTRTGYTFNGWCDVATTFNSTTRNQECSGTTYDPGDTYEIDQTADGSNIVLYAMWNANEYTITFEPHNGESAIVWTNRKYGEELGTLPAPIKAEYVLDGWYPNTSYVDGQKISSETLVTGTITYHAHWVETLFPVVWNQMGACTFNGATNSNITGSECEDYWDVKFIDTGIALYSQENYLKDYEIHFTIDHYLPSEQVNQEGDNNQQTFVSDKLGSQAGDKKAPGVIVRRNGNTNIDFNSRMNDVVGPGNVQIPYGRVSDVSIFRLNNKVYYSVNDGPLILLQDITGFSEQFPLTTTFGAYPGNECIGDGNPDCTYKRIPQATLSNMYIRLGEATDEDIHTVNFKVNDGTSAIATTYLIKDSDSITTLPEAPTYTDHLFQGWFTAASGGTEVTAATVPTASTDYYAHWLGTVVLANLADDSFELDPQETGTIVVTNSAEIESYTFSSDNPLVAAVDNTGVITALAPGNTTITMTGSTSGDTKTISVTVNGETYDVSFNAQGGTPVDTVSVGEGSRIDPLPTSIKSGYRLVGWFTGLNGTGTQLLTSTVFNENTPTEYYAYWEEVEYVCKIATTLHTETCGNTNANYGCRKAGYALNGEITYGNIVESSTKSYGDAYNCDINNDGEFNEANERFYYIGSNNGNAALVYYRNEPDDSNYNWTNGSDALPDSTLWTNPLLVAQGTKVSRFMTVDEVTEICGGTTQIAYKFSDSTKGKCGWIAEESSFAYASGKLDTIWLQRVNGANRRVHLRDTQAVQTPATTSVNGVRPVIEVPLDMVESYIEKYAITFDPHNETSSTTVNINAGQALGENYPANPLYTSHVFQGWFTADTGGTKISSSTVPTGATTYHAQWLKSVALAQLASDSINIAEGSTSTINVLNASELEEYRFDSDDTDVATVNATTGVITAVAEGTTTITMTGTVSGDTKTISVTVLDPSAVYTISFNAHGGTPTPSDISVPAGGTIGSQLPSAPTYANHAFMGWFTADTGGTEVTSATTPSGSTTYHAQWKLDVTNAVVSNDLILTAGDNITIVVNNAADLEPYTFSSSDTDVFTVNENTGTITGVGAGTANVIMTGTKSNLTKSFAVEVAPIMHTVTFNPNGGTTPTPFASTEIADGAAVGSLPTTTKTDYVFFGWYTDDGTFYEEVKPTTTIDDDVTFYARWIESTASLPVVWSEINECTFNGNSAVTGDDCEKKVANQRYIDSDIKLFDENNIGKDFELGFTIVEYDYTAQVSGSGNNSGMQATFVNTKLEATGYPGFVIRRSGNTLNLTAKFSGTENRPIPNDTISPPDPSTLKHVKIVRSGNVLYYSWNGGTLTKWWDLTGFNTTFNTEVWFGSAAASNGTSPMRPLVGKLTDMYIRLATASTSYTINFNVGSGSFVNPASDSSRTITANDQLGTLPVPNPPSEDFTFAGWWDESVSPAVQISASTVPDGNKTYKAHYSYNSSDTPVEFDISNNATRGYEALISEWTQSPVNIAIFNEATSGSRTPAINNSTWGDANELSELEYWTAMRTNFVNNQCLIKTNSSHNTNSDATKPLSELPNFTSGSVDCSKPDAYDTKIGSALNVYLNNAQGEQVAYAKAENGVIHNMIPGQTYYWEDQNDSTVYGYVTAVSNGSSTGTRWVDTGVVRNARDLGGLPVTYTDSNSQTVTGTLAYGRLFRGEKLQNVNATELTNLGINTEYNVGDEYSSDTHIGQPNVDYHLNPVIHYDFDYHSGDENNDSSNYMKAWLAVTNIMLDITNTNTTKNVYFHCRVGADRTGTIAYLLEGLLGVPDEKRYEEYELTYLSGLYDRTRYYKEKVGGSTNPTSKFVYMMGYVKTNAQIYNWYMQNPNADAGLIQDFRTAMTVTNS